MGEPTWKAHPESWDVDTYDRASTVVSMPANKVPANLRPRIAELKRAIAWVDANKPEMFDGGSPDEDEAGQAPEPVEPPNDEGDAGFDPSNVHETVLPEVAISAQAPSNPMSRYAAARGPVDPSMFGDATGRTTTQGMDAPRSGVSDFDVYLADPYAASARGALDTYGMGVGPHMAGLGAKLAGWMNPDPEGERVRLAQGIAGAPTGQSDYSAGVAGEDLQNAQAQAREPESWAAGRAGALGQMGLATGGAGMTRAMTYGGGIPAAAGIGGVNSGLRSRQMNADGSPDWGGRAIDAAGGGVVSGALAGLTGLAGYAAGRAGQALGEKANMSRAAASGGTPAEMKAIEASGGPGTLSEFGADIERMGLHRKPGNVLSQRAGAAGTLGAAGAVGGYMSEPGKDETRGGNALKYGVGGALLGALANPASPSVYLQNAAAARAKAGEEISAVLTEAEARGVSVPTQWVVGRLRNLRNSYPKTTRFDEAKAAEIDDLISRVKGEFGKTMTPAEVNALKTSYTDRVWRNGNISPTETDVSNTYRDAASAPRTALRDQLTRKAPDLQQRMAPAMRDYGTAASVEGMAQDRMASDVGKQPLRLTEAATGSPIGAMTARGAARYGQDAAANMMRAGQKGLSGLGSFLNPMSRIPQLAGVSGGGPGFRTFQQYAEQRNAPPMIPNVSTQTPEQQAQQKSDKSLGYQDADNIQRILENDPSGQPFGPVWTPVLREAFDSGDDSHIRSAVSSAMSDPQFQAIYK